MSTAIALRMVGADFLKLRKKRGTVIWALRAGARCRC